MGLVEAIDRARAIHEQWEHEDEQHVRDPHAPGCPVRNAMAKDDNILATSGKATADGVWVQKDEATGLIIRVTRKDGTLLFDRMFGVRVHPVAESVVDETARERAVHDGSPKVRF